ncbi:MAG: RnfABCDGE type electron transport complex subunit D [Sedimentisphaerales bacterium]|nr:RnfABCDGE type electron transport complex subunit D [Sedimentisphaerales bacterium]
MAEQSDKSNKQDAKILMVSSSPHLAEAGTSKRIMFEVVIGMLPAVAMSVYLFLDYAAVVLISSVLACVVTEWIFNAVRKRPQTTGDGSAIVTGLILGLSLPPSLPWWAVVLGAVVAMGVGKMVFGGLGSNIFNPAMVGRAFLMACFGMMMTTWTIPLLQQETIINEDGTEEVVAITQATPLGQAKAAIRAAADDEKNNIDRNTCYTIEVDGQWKDMFMGNISGSLGETSTLCWLVGGLFLLFRRTITYHIPLAILATVTFISAIVWMINPDVYANPMVHLSGGGLMMCAFFIATDPVTCPLSKLGRVIFGIGIGALVMLIRLVGGYPEGVMYAVLLMNSVTPLLDRWTRPTPLGGHAGAN